MLETCDFVIIFRIVSGKPTKIVGEMIKSYYFIWQSSQFGDYFAIFVIFRSMLFSQRQIPANHQFLAARKASCYQPKSNISVLSVEQCELLPSRQVNCFFLPFLFLNHRLEFSSFRTLSGLKCYNNIQ